MTTKDRFEIAVKGLEFRLNFHYLLARMPVLANSTNPYPPAFDRLSAIFVHVPKAAGSSVAHALFGGNVGHKPISRFRAHDAQKCSQYFTFSFVRNPWDRLWSAYRYFCAVVGMRAHRDHRWATQMLADKHDFRDFVLALGESGFRAAVKRYDHFRDQADWLCIRGRLAVDFVGRYEQLDEDFGLVCDQLGVSVDTLPQLRVSTAGGDYVQQYSPRMVACVEEVYQRDIELFGYRFGAPSDTLMKSADTTLLEASE